MIPVTKKHRALHQSVFSRLAARIKIQAPVIGATNIYAGGGSSEPFEALRIGFGVDVGPASWWFAEPAIFRRHTITPADVGKTFSEDASTDPSFTEVVSRLTNGVDDIAFLNVTYVPDTGSGGGSGVQESIAFKGSDLLNGIDFAGHKISRIRMHIDSLKFFVDDEPLYRYELNVTILIEKHSPFHAST